MSFSPSLRREEGIRPQSQNPRTHTITPDPSGLIPPFLVGLILSSGTVLKFTVGSRPGRRQSLWGVISSSILLFFSWGLFACQHVACLWCWSLKGRGRQYLSPDSNGWGNDQLSRPFLQPSSSLVPPSAFPLAVGMLFPLPSTPTIPDRHLSRAAPYILFCKF